jgi:hypothetical protein
MPRSARASQSSSPRERIIAYLNQNGGRVESPDGLGLTAEMAKKTGYNQVAALNAMLVRLESEGIITRNVRGKRTLAISLGSGRAGAKKTAAKKTASRRPAAKRTGARRTTARKATRSAGRSTASSNVADQVASLGRDVDALARKIRQLQRVVAR